jgi:hypothetical protein
MPILWIGREIVDRSVPKLVSPTSLLIHRIPCGENIDRDAVCFVSLLNIVWATFDFMLYL